MNSLSPAEIIRLFEEPSSDRRTLKKRLTANGQADSIVAALRLSQSILVRQILCDVLGDRHEWCAAEALTVCLADPEPSVRSAAADALAKIQNPQAGEPLLERFQTSEQDLGVRRMLAVALGAVRCVAAVPSLIDSLRHADASLRGSAAWALGAMGSKVSIPALQEAIAIETSPYAVQRMHEALQILHGVP